MPVEIYKITAGNFQISIPFCQYTLNDSQQFCVMATDFDRLKNVIEFGISESGVKTESIGKLYDQNFIFQSQIVNSLKIDNWDFEHSPNPEIIVLTVLDKESS